jgi:splicing factor 3B subunit 3
VDDVPLALLGLKGRLCAGVGKALRIYEMGKKKLLRKSENKVRAYINPRFLLLNTISEFLLCDRYA